MTLEGFIIGMVGAAAFILAVYLISKQPEEPKTK
jgi:hypothetical protein